MSERDLGPFVVTTNTSTRRWPRTGIMRVGDEDAYRVGVWVAGGGRMLGLSRSKWWLRQATWRNQLTCWAIHRWYCGPFGRSEVHLGHRQVRVVTKAGLRGSTPDTAEVLVLADRIDCGRCGITVRGPEWVNRP